MFKKLLNGEYSLFDTFWKFGILGFLICNFLLKVSQKLLHPRLLGYTIKDYYTAYLPRATNVDNITVTFTLFYIACILLIASYSYTMVAGIWRSSAEYNKSIWLRYLARFIIIILALISLKGIFG